METFIITLMSVVGVTVVVYAFIAFIMALNLALEFLTASDKDEARKVLGLLKLSPIWPLPLARRIRKQLELVR